MAVSTQVRLIDEMTAPINHILGAMNTMLNTMSDIGSMSESSFGSENIMEMRQNIEVAQQEMQELSESLNGTGRGIKNNADEQQKFNDEIAEGNSLAGNLFDKFKSGIGVLAGMAGIKSTVDFISNSMDDFDTQLDSEVQLATVLGNMVGNGAESAYRSITDKASEIQSRGIYGDEAMIAGAGELATYFTDPEAITAMMDTLANYTMGMTGGGAVGSEEMVNYATNLGKIMSGAYDAMTKKGFEFTDAQKAVIEGTATEEQYIEALGEGYKDMSEDMRAATAINDIIEESWSGLYDTMSDTPRGAIIQMQNAFGDLREEVGERAYPSVMNLVNVIMENAPVINDVIMGFAEVVSVIIDILAFLTDGVLSVAEFISDNWTVIEPIITGVVIAFTAFNAVLLIHAGYLAAVKAATAIATAASIIHGTVTAEEAAATSRLTAEQLGLNVAMLSTVLVIVAIVGAVYAVVYAVNEVTGSSVSALGIILGALNAFAALLRNLFIGILDVMLTVAETGADGFVNLANNLTTIFANIKITCVGIMADMADDILSIIEKTAIAIDNVFGTNLASGVSAFRQKVQTAADMAIEDIVQDAELKKLDYSDLRKKLEDIGVTFQYNDIQAAYEEGYSAGNSLEKYGLDVFKKKDMTVEDLFSKMKYMQPNTPEVSVPDIDEIKGNTGEIAANTGDISNKLNSSDEDLKLLREMAEREAVNRFTTAEIRVEMGGVTNQINSDMDIDGFADAFRDRLEEAMISAAEGVRVS